MLWRLIALFSLAASSLVSAADGPLQPTGKWVADFADTQCLLSRSYGTDAKPLILSFEQFPMDDGIGINIIERNNRRRGLDNGDARVGFGKSASENVKFGAYTTKEDLRRVQVDVEDGSYKEAADSEIIDVSVPGEVQKTFAVPGFADALKVLRSCVIDLGEHWGIPADEQLRIATPVKPVGRLEGLFTPDDYPEAAIKSGDTGRTTVRIGVDESGDPTNCVVLRGSGVKSLDDTTCRVFRKRGHFHPAIDKSGRPVKSVFVQSVDWLMM